MYKYLHICACTYPSIGSSRPSLALIARKCSYPLNWKVIEFSTSLPLLLGASMGTYVRFINSGHRNNKQTCLSVFPIECGKVLRLEHCERVVCET